MIKELDSVVLAVDLPEHGLKQGEIGTIVLVHRSGEGYEVESMALDGEILAVVTLSPSQVRSIGHGEIANAPTGRELVTLNVSLVRVTPERGFS